MADEKNGIVYRHTVETLINNVLRTHGLLNASAQAELMALGINAARVHDIAFPVWTTLLNYSAKMNSPDKLPEDAMVMLGRRWVEGYDTTFLGKTTGMLARLVGPQKMLMQMTNNWKSVNNFYVSTCVARGPKDVEITLNVAGVVRHFNVGIMTRMLELIGVRNGRVVSHEAPPGSHFRVTW